MLHVDIPSRADIERLIKVRAPACMSLYLPTTPITEDAQADRIALKTTASGAFDQLRAKGANKRDLWPMEQEIDDLIEDDDFWAHQARSLAVFVTPDTVSTFRLPNTLQPLAETGDRFFIKPLLRAVTVPQSAFVLALTQGSARLVEVSGDMPAAEIRIPDMPRDAASAVGKASILGRAPSGRLQGSEGQKVRLGQYARQVDQALRELLVGRETPLILAANDPLDAIYRSMNTYPHLARESISGSLDRITDAELAQQSRAILDSLHRTDLQDIARTFEARAGQGRTTTDIVQAARAATFGAVAVLLVDIDEIVPGTVDEEDGSVVLAESSTAGNNGVVDQIAGRALLSGARVLGVRRADIPGGGSLAAILRYPF